VQLWDDNKLKTIKEKLCITLISQKLIFLSYFFCKGLERLLLEIVRISLRSEDQEVKNFVSFLISRNLSAPGVKFPSSRDP
jgi:hypothetical protein